MPWYLYIALKQLFPTGRFSFFTAISVLGVALGVMLLVITTSVMGGFGYEIRKMIVETQGDIQVVADGQFGSAAIDDPAALRQAVGRIPGVVATTAFAEGICMLQFNDRTAYPLVHGVDVDNVTEVIPFHRYISQGSLDQLDDDSVILSYALAQTLGARTGSEIEVYSRRVFESISRDEAFLPRRLVVAGIFEIGHQQLDSSLVIVTLRRMQDLAGLKSAVQGLNVKIAAELDADEVAARINGALPMDVGARARSWMDANKDFLWVLQLERNMIFFLLTFIIVVAAFSVMSSLLISVVRKTREIGLLGALGANSRQIALCFCFQGLLIGAAGTAVGLVMGFGAVAIRNDFIAAFTRWTQTEDVLQRFYQFRNLPAHTTSSDLISIVVCSIVISTLAGLFPAWRAARLKPVEALRSE